MPTAPVGYLALLRGNRSFRALFSARVVSLLGDWFNTLAVLALLRTIEPASASSFGWVIILKTLPAIVVAPAAGVVADRFSRRAVMIAADVGRALVVLSMLCVAWWPSATLLYSLVALQTAMAAFFEPAKAALLPDVVLPEELTAANALSAAAWSAMLTLGAALGGVVTAKLGWQVALVVDAASYMLSIVFLLRVLTPRRPPDAARRPTGLLDLLGVRDVVAGVGYVARRPRVWTLLLVKSAWCVAGSITLILTLLGERIYAVPGWPLFAVALLYAARGLGTGAGPMLARWWSRSEPAAMERAITLGFATGGVFYLALPAASHLGLAAVLVVLAHIGGATIWVFSTIRLQEIVPSEVRGRVFATELGLFTVVLATSTWAYGQAIDHGWLPLWGAMVLLGATLLAAAGLWALRGRWLGWATG